MYAVMFYVILNKRKLHFPLAKNVMHSPSLGTLTSGGEPADSYHRMVEKPCPCVPLLCNTDLFIIQCCHCADLCTTNGVIMQ